MTMWATILSGAALGCLLAGQAGAGEMLPADHGPTDPEVGDKVPLAPLTRRAIAMFDPSPQSRRHYDLVDCLDGLTFAFGNFPQMQLLEFFKEVQGDQGGATFKALLARLREHFLSNKAGWTRFASHAGIDGSKDPSEDAIRQGLTATLLNPTFMKPYAKKFPVKLKTATECTAIGGAASRSFFDDHAVWFRPAMRHTFRDSDIVGYQVRYWERHYLSRGVAAAEGLKLPAESGSILLTFIRSNSKQVPEPPRTTLLKGKAPDSMVIAGRGWRWNGSDRPPQRHPPT